MPVWPFSHPGQCVPSLAPHHSTHLMLAAFLQKRVGRMQKTHLLGILQIYFQVLVAPHDARVLVGRGVRETIDGSRGATDDAPEVGALAVLATLCSSARRSRQTVRKSCMHSQTSVQETDRGRRCASEKYTDLSMPPPPHQGRKLHEHAPTALSCHVPGQRCGTVRTWS